MRQAMIIVPALFLLGLIALGFGMYKSTEANAPCTGDGCAELTDQQLADMAIEARTR